MKSIANGGLPLSHYLPFLGVAAVYGTTGGDWSAGDLGRFRVSPFATLLLLLLVGVGCGGPSHDDLDVAVHTERDVGPVTLGDPSLGKLDARSPRLDDGKYFDLYSLMGREGDLITIDASSRDFRPVVHIQTIGPDGIWHRVINDKWLLFTLPSTGQYDIYVTSLREGDVGEYTLTVSSGAMSEDRPHPDWVAYSQIWGSTYYYDLSNIQDNGNEELLVWSRQAHREVQTMASGTLFNSSNRYHHIDCNVNRSANMHTDWYLGADLVASLDLTAREQVWNSFDSGSVIGRLRDAICRLRT